MRSAIMDKAGLGDQRPTHVDDTTWRELCAAGVSACSSRPAARGPYRPTPPLRLIGEELTKLHRRQRQHAAAGLRELAGHGRIGVSGVDLPVEPGDDLVWCARRH